MIRKELDSFERTDKYAISGRKAEEKMAFYLKRYFEANSEIHVLNSIRLEFNNDAAQIDHLIIHPFGMTIVESKSVHGKIQIKEDGQWIRWYGNQSKGMASPITQARLQASFLRDALNRSSTPKNFFNNISLQILVAISDDGLILWPKTGKIDEVWKADQIADSLVSIQSKAITNKQTVLLSQKHIDKICDFLIRSHKPLDNINLKNDISEKLHSTAPIKAQLEVPKLKSNHFQQECDACNSRELEIRFGFTYYFHCRDCEKNSPIVVTCQSCKALGKLRKQKKEFYSDCRQCNTSILFYVNS